MAFDLNETLSEMLGAVKKTVGDNWSMIKETANNFLQDRKDRLELLVSLRLNNEINNEFFLKRLQDEKKIFESELHAVAVISKAIAQKAANAAIDILEKAVMSAIKIG
jgi:hypothetical protein